MLKSLLDGHRPGLHHEDSGSLWRVLSRVVTWACQSFRYIIWSPCGAWFGSLGKAKVEAVRRLLERVQEKLVPARHGGSCL